MEPYRSLFPSPLTLYIGSFLYYMIYEECQMTPKNIYVFPYVAYICNVYASFTWELLLGEWPMWVLLNTLLCIVVTLPHDMCRLSKHVHIIAFLPEIVVTKYYHIQN